MDGDTVREKLFALLDTIDKECDIECHSRIKDFMKGHGFEDVQVSVDDMFDSPGIDIYSVSVAWVENGKAQLAVGSISCY